MFTRGEWLRVLVTTLCRETNPLSVHTVTLVAGTVHLSRANNAHKATRGQAQGLHGQDPAAAFLTNSNHSDFARLVAGTKFLIPGLDFLTKRSRYFSRKHLFPRTSRKHKSRTGTDPHFCVDCRINEETLLF